VINFSLSHETSYSQATYISLSKRWV
jgi:hypothetical protein